MAGYTSDEKHFIFWKIRTSPFWNQILSLPQLTNQRSKTIDHTKNTSITEILQDSKDTSRTYTHIFRLMDDDVDYESLGGKYPMSVNAAAGAIAGYFEVKFFIALATYKFLFLACCRLSYRCRENTDANHPYRLRSHDLQSNSGNSKYLSI